MSTTTMTGTQNTPEQPHAPEITVLTRVASIPMISSSLVAINDALSTNSYTTATYSTAKGLSTNAYNLTEPLQVKLAPLIIRADGYANMAVDVVENRYPYPFGAQPEEVVSYVRERRESTTTYIHGRVNNVNKAIDEKVRAPVLNVAQDIDQRFAPLVDYFEAAVSRLNHPEAGPSQTPPDAQSQYHRALALSKSLCGRITAYTTEQVKQIQAHSILPSLPARLLSNPLSSQKASQSTQFIASTAASSVTSARVHLLVLLEKLQKLHYSILTFPNDLWLQSHYFQGELQQSYTELSAAWSATVLELTDIAKDKDLPVQEKVGRVGKEVSGRLQSLLETVKERISAPPEEYSIDIAFPFVVMGENTDTMTDGVYGHH